jgi:Protein of unknown function (DUF3486)
MTAKSSLLSLDPQILAACHEALRAGKTVDQITAALQGMGADVSRSAVGRYLHTAREQLAEHRLALDLAAFITPRLGEESKGDIAVMVRELAKVGSLKMITQLNAALDADTTTTEDLEKMDANSATLQRLTRAIANLSRTESINLNVREQIAEQARKRALDEAAAAIRSGAKRAGISDEKWAIIESELKLL